jgi:peptidyl-prolyl cis-trans isomerase A (cyclophilin A)
MLGEITGSVTLIHREGVSIGNYGTMPGVTVEVFGSSAIPIESVRTNSDGTFRFRLPAYSARVQPLDLGRAARSEEELYDVRFWLGNFDRVVVPSVRVAPGTRVVVNADLDTHPANCNGFLFEPWLSGKLVCAQTPLGGIFIKVDTEHAPITSANFLKYVDAHLYDGGRFYRVTRPDNYSPVLPDRPMMNIIQGGMDPAARRFPTVPLERTSVTGLKHVTGSVSMARGTPDSATSEFFILLDDQPSLDFGGKRFADGQGGAVFGSVSMGLDVVRKIQQMAASDQNLTPPVPILTICRLVPGDAQCR